MRILEPAHRTGGHLRRMTLPWRQLGVKQTAKMLRVGRRRTFNRNFRRRMPRFLSGICLMMLIVRIWLSCLRKLELLRLLRFVFAGNFRKVIYNRETDTSRGFGFVTMSAVEEAEKAVEMFHRYDLDGRLLTVNKAAPRGTQPPERPRPGSETGYIIYVGNLPWAVDNGHLEQIFSEHGKVVNARVVYDRDSGRSRGFGFVTMSTEAEMNDAIAALDGQNVDGRAIRVSAAEGRPRRSF
uniref:Uncharacterized protein MANES_05G005400 n=1 Tax=Rhizophora mucronata TaxID=61149 RepID=A0A2P2LNP5_RHIMU